MGLNSWHGGWTPNGKLFHVHNYILVISGSVPSIYIPSHTYQLLWVRIIHFNQIWQFLWYKIPLLLSHGELFPIQFILRYDKIIGLVAGRVGEWSFSVGQGCSVRYLLHLRPLQSLQTVGTITFFLTRQSRPIHRPRGLRGILKQCISATSGPLTEMLFFHSHNYKMHFLTFW